MRSLFFIIVPSLFILALLSSCGKSTSPSSSSQQKQQGAQSSNAQLNKKEAKAKRKAEKKEHKAEEKRKKKAASANVKKVIKTARGYTGTPYRLGGTSRSGIDCSGLTTRSFEAIDMKLPRTAKEQSKLGKEVKLKDTAPGDLVFFSERKNSSKIVHVGIITVVEKESVRFIHASTKLGVVENELLTGYYRPLLVKIRRVL